MNETPYFEQNSHSKSAVGINKFGSDSNRLMKCMAFQD